MPFFDFKKQKIFYHVIEKKTQETIIFIHGSGESSYVWKDQMTGLNLEYNLIALDLPSHARSGEVKKISLDLYVDAIKSLVEHLNVKKVILAGHSLGGAIAQAYYFKYKNDVSALILCATGAKLRVSQVIFDALERNYKEYLKTVPVGAFYRKTPKEVIDDYLDEIDKLEAEIAYKDFEICNNFDLMDKTKLIYVPCLIMCGNADKLTPPRYSQYFDEKIRDSTFKIIKNAGHMIMLEQPDEVNLTIQEFVENKLK